MRWPPKRILAAGAALYLVMSVLYGAANLWHWRAPFVMPVSGVDRAIPFVDWSIWIYLSHFAMQAWLVAELARQGTLRPLAAVAWASVVSISAFFIFPTTLPVLSAFPSGPLSQAGFLLVERLNTPANSFPSLHVSLAAIAATALWRMGPKHGAIAVAWATAIVLSTLTARQHTALDVPAGLAVAWLSWRLSRPLEAA